MPVHRHERVRGGDRNAARNDHAPGDLQRRHRGVVRVSCHDLDREAGAENRGERHPGADDQGGLDDALEGVLHSFRIAVGRSGEDREGRGDEEDRDRAEDREDPEGSRRCRCRLRCPPARSRRPRPRCRASQRRRQRRMSPSAEDAPPLFAVEARHERHRLPDERADQEEREDSHRNRRRERKASSPASAKTRVTTSATHAAWRRRSIPVIHPSRRLTPSGTASVCCAVVSTKPIPATSVPTTITVS